MYESTDAILSKVVFVVVLVAASGCGTRTPYTCVPVSGKVTYEDGSAIPADSVRLVFLSSTAPVDPKMPPKHGIAFADGKTGTFAFATTYTYKDGIVAGQHKVIVQPIRNNEMVRGLVADDFSDAAKTPLTAQSSQSPFVFKVRKPR